MQEAVGLLDSIAEFCRRANMAESTFGRRAVNDGKFVSRLRDGARITPETLERLKELGFKETVPARVAKIRRGTIRAEKLEELSKLKAVLSVKRVTE